MALKILLADDSMTAQNMGKKILVDAGYDVVAVSNGAAAIKKIASERPDIAILDEYMPGYTGSEVCERVKAAAETAKIPVLLTVGKMEVFDPEKANKVRADGVMIKPFEASDLIAAVQSIAQRLLAPSPAPRLEMGTVQLRQGQAASIEDTQRIAAAMPAGAGHDDTLRIGAPKASAASYEETLRLTAQQIKAFQDKTYHEWKDTAEPHLEEHEKAAAAEMPVAAAEPATPAMVPEEAAAMMVEPPAESRETPVFSALAAAGVTAQEPYLTGNGPVPPAATSADAEMPAFYTPPVVAEEPAMPLPEIAVQPEPPVAPEPVTPPVVAEVAPVVPEVEPVLEVAPLEATVEPPVVEAEAMIAPEMVAPAILSPAILEPVLEVAPVLETSAPLTPGPMPVAPVAALEPTIAPAVEVAAAPAHELEITSPPQEHGVVVEQDAALITESDDMSQFTTRFGVENAEPVHVGVTSDLTPEQLAAITTPLEEPAAVPEPLIEAGPVTSAVEAPAEVELVTEAPVLETPVVAVPEVEPAEPVTAAVEAPASISPVQEQVGTIHAVEPIEADEPIVAYVPGITETQPLMAIQMPESVVSPVVETAPVVAVPEPVVNEPAAIEAPAVVEEAPAVEPVVSIPEPVVAEAAPVAVEAPVVAEPQPVEAVAQPVSTEPAIAEEHKGSEVESVVAAAAAAAVASVAGVAHVIHAAPHVEEPVHEAETPAVERVPQPESFGDAALAEELAAALANKETEEHAKAAADAAAVAALEPAASASAETKSAPVHDERIAEAIARAFENLKPKLISEIVKELKK